jgi:glycosyltransferase involved in cell wall biosynthesis
LWALLFDALCVDGIRLTVAYSDPPEVDLQKKDNCELPAEYGLKVHGHRLWPSGLVYQPLLTCSLNFDLLIVEQANRLLLNHFLLPLSRAGLQRVAFWGQGRNYLAEQIHISEWYRRKTLNWVSWWFAYTEGSARYLETQGVPIWKITVLRNSVDTREIHDHVRSLTSQDREAVRGRLGIPVLAPVGIFCGMLDKAKGLPFLIESSKIVKGQMPEFHLILVGGGPEKDAVLGLIEGLDWVHWAGPQFGKRKSELMAISDAFLLPCKVGLAILDAFAAGLPLITTKFEFHAPEIEYLEEGVNGLITDADPRAFAEGVLSLLNQTDYLGKLRAGASASAEKYSIENFAENFRTGIRSCLGLPVSSARVLEL